MNPDDETRRIKDDHYRSLASGHATIIEKTSYGCRVHQWTPNGVAPQSEYDTPHEAIARVAQLFGIQSPIVPQTWPEEACIGQIIRD